MGRQSDREQRARPHHLRVHLGHRHVRERGGLLRAPARPVTAHAHQSVHHPPLRDRLYDVILGGALSPLPRPTACAVGLRRRTHVPLLCLQVSIVLHCNILFCTSFCCMMLYDVIHVLTFFFHSGFIFIPFEML